MKDLLKLITIVLFVASVITVTGGILHLLKQWSTLP